LKTLPVGALSPFGPQAAMIRKAAKAIAKRKFLIVLILYLKNEFMMAQATRHTGRRLNAASLKQKQQQDTLRPCVV
jgi:hypothetical protein